MVRFLLVLAAVLLVLYLIFSEVFATAERFKHKAECRTPLAAYMHGGSPKDLSKCEVNNVRQP
jgi:hypothetical protein